MTTPSQGGKKPRRQDVHSAENLCSYCEAKCCRYFALPIDTPDSWREFDFIRWFLLHEGATVFVEDDAWYLLVHSECRHLGESGLCEIYAERPEICRNYSTNRCEYDDDWVYQCYWELPEQVQEYAEAVLGPRKRGSIRSSRPGRLQTAAGP